MIDEIEKRYIPELTSEDLDSAVGGVADRVNLSDLSIVKTLEKTSTASGGGAGKVQMQDFHFAQK